MNNIENYLGFQSLLYDGEVMYFPSYDGNGLFCIEDGVVSCLTQFRNERIGYGTKLFGDIKKYGDYIVLVPETANQIEIYDLKKKNTKSIVIDNMPNNSELTKFQLGLIIKDSIVMFPTYYPGIMIKNLINEEEIVIDEWITELDSYNVRGRDAFLGFNYVERGSKVYIPSCRAHAVLEFDKDDFDVVVRNVGSVGYSSICDDGTDLWLMPRYDGEIVRWNPQSDQIRTYGNYPRGYRPGGTVGSVYRAGFVYSFPETGNMVLKINIATGDMEEMELFSDMCQARLDIQSIDKVAFTSVYEHGSSILAYSGKAAVLVEYNLLDDRINCLRIDVPREVKDYFYEIRTEREKKYFNQGIAVEESTHHLPNLIKFVCGEL